MPAIPCPAAVGVIVGSTRTSDSRLMAQLAARLGSPAATSIGRHCPRCGSSEHGRPVVAEEGLQISLSGSGTLRLVALSTLGRVGVDVQQVEAERLADATRLMLHEMEAAETAQERACTWVRKEALLKAAGCGLSTPMSSIRLTRPSDSPEVLAWPAELPAQPWVRDLALPQGYLGAVAGLGVPPGRVRVLMASPEATC